MIVRLLALLGLAGCGGANPEGYLRREPSPESLVGDWVPAPETAAIFAARGVEGSTIAIRADGTTELTKVPNWPDLGELTGNTLNRTGTWSVKWDKTERRWGVWLKLAPRGGDWLGFSFPVWVVGGSEPEQLIGIVGEGDARQIVRFVKRT